MQNSAAEAALRSWDINWLTIALLLALAIVYLVGWWHANESGKRLFTFLGGLALLFIALQSPLDVFGSFYLWVHMTQHLLLMIAAPLLIVYARPKNILMRGLPRAWVRDQLGPVLRLPEVRWIQNGITFPPFAWGVFAFNLVFWHLPRFYSLALSSPVWHDVQHASFFWAGILFWWPLINPRRGWPMWAGIPYLLLADILNTAFSAFLIFSGRLFYPEYAATRLGALGAMEDQVLAGLIMWVPGSVFYLIPALVIGARLLGSRGKVQIGVSRRLRVLPITPLHVRKFGRPVMLLASAAVIAGLLVPSAGSSVSSAVVWFGWRAALILALVVFGNLFCMTCPLTLVRDLARKVIVPGRQWPGGLRTKWIAIALIGVYLWIYDAFAPWERPELTAWIIVGYFVSIVAVDCIFRGSNFCKYVCPVGQFNFIVSTLSPAEIRVKDQDVCGGCQTHDCIRGNDRARGCELRLFQPTKSGNMDCTFCLDCVQACPSHNVALLPRERRGPVAVLTSRSDLAALAALVVFGAFVNAAGMLERFEPVAGEPLRFAAFIVASALLIPVLCIGVCAMLNAAFLPRTRVRETASRSIFALVPLGVAMWSAHLFVHVAPVPTSMSTIRQIDILMLDVGLLATIFGLWKVAGRHSIPWSVLATALYITGVWILFQPMRMPGMSM